MGGDGSRAMMDFIEYVVPFLICVTFVNGCSFDVVGEIVFCASFDEF